MSRLPVALALLALPIGAAACGGSGKSSPTGASTASSSSTSSPATAVADAVRKTIAAGSEHVQVVASVAAAGRKVRVVGSGDFETPSRRGSLRASFSLSGTKTSLDEVQSGTTLYIGSPLFAAVLPAGKKWLKVDLATAGKTLGIDASVLAAQDPAAALEQLKAITGLKEVGTATLGGVQTTRYRGRIDTSKLSTGEAEALRSTGTTLGPYEVWVGSDGYVHRVRVTTSASSSGQTARTVVTSTLSKFGETVQVSVPAASEAVDATKVTIPGIGG